MNNSKLKIYLAGTSILNNYRNIVKEKYKDSDVFEIIDPFDYEKLRDYINNEHEKIINEDLELLNKADILIADMTLSPTFGTTSEIALMHHLFKKPVFIFNVPGKYINDVWLYGQSTKVFKNLNECLNYLEDKFL